MGMVRIHLFALGFPAWLAAVLSRTSLVRRRAVLVAALAAAALTLFVFAFYAVTGSAPAFELFLANVHTLHEPTAYRGWYAGLLEGSGRALAVPLGTLAVLAAGLGVFLLLYPAALVAAASRRPLAAVDCVPAGLLIFYVLLMMSAPISAHGDSTELTQRPFVLLYAIMAVWSAAVLTDWVRARLHLRPHLVKGAVVAGIVAGLLVWPLAGALARPKFHWGWQHVTYRVDDGLLEVASYLRRNSRPGDIFAVAGLTLHWVATDTATQLQSLTGMPAYLARPFTHMFRGNAREREALRRHRLLAQVAAEAQAAVALERLRRLGVRWYVHRGEAGPSWDPGRRHAAFADGSVAVYRSE
jgi:hypothetical protein